MDSLVFCAVDTGNGDAKAVRWKDSSRREIVSAVVPSIVSYGSPGISPATGKVSSPLYRLDGQNITVGGASVNQVMVHKTGNISPERKAVALEALSRVGLGGHRLAVATNLPLQDAVTRDDFGLLKMDTDALVAKSNLLSKGEVLKRDAQAPIITKAVCQPEGFAAYIDRVVGNDGSDLEKPGALTAFVDIGAGTVNVGIVASGFELVDCFKTIRMGTNDILARLGGLLEQEFRSRTDMKLDRFEPAVLRQVMSQRKIDVLGSTVHVGPLVDQAIKGFARDIEQAVRAEIGKHFSSLSEILLVGGGAVLLREAFVEWPGVTVPVQPAFANARGLLKLVTYLCDHGDIVEAFLDSKEAVGA